MLPVKTTIDLALDIRSYERVVVISEHAGADRRPAWHDPRWTYPENLTEAVNVITPDSVVVVDGQALTRRLVQYVGGMCPRLIAIRPINEEHARSVRKILTSLYPWSEAWTVASEAGRFIVVKGSVGRVYDRDRVVDMRTGALA